MKEKYKEIFRIEGALDIPTLNSWARIHHYKRHKYDHENQEAFGYMLNKFKGLYIIKTFEIEVYSNRGDDVDNTIIIAKNFVDALKKSGMVQNDSRKFYKGCYLGIDDTLQKKHFCIIVKGIFTQINK